MLAFSSINKTSPSLRVRLLLALVLLGVLASAFWTSSRYPSLDEKALMGGAIQLEDPLSFEALIPINPSDSVYRRIAFTTINWLDTNREGMMFGLLFAAGFLTLLGYLKKRSFSGGLSNSFFGLVLGAPLGVCVNCAAPIARGLFAGGTRVETMLAAMIASPTLNVVVLTMLFSLFPFYIAATKVALSVFVILVLVPIVAKALPAEQRQKTTIDAQVCSIPNSAAAYAGNSTVLSSVVLFVKDYLSNLWFVVRKTVPYMVLAGFLGAIVATLVPTELILEQPFSVPLLLLVGIVGLFAPVPIGFDVVLSAVFLNSGLDIAYVMTLLFTLGIFSVYSGIIVATSVSLRAALLITVGILVVGLGAGVFASHYNDWQQARALERLLSSDAVQSHPIDSNAHAQANMDNNKLRVLQAGLSQSKASAITVSSVPYNNSAAPSKTQTPFTQHEAWHYGIDNPVEFSFRDMWPPFWEGRSIATGDIDNDGDIDVVIASTEVGLYRFDNNGDGKFTRQTPALDKFETLPVFNAVLVDINDDGWLDLFITTYAQGNFWVKNSDGEFNFADAQSVANRDDAMLSLAVSFGDVDGDGDLDAALGNWSAGWYRRIPGDESKNRIVYNDSGVFDGSHYQELSGIPGETLSILFSDIDNNSTLDLLVANDFEIPDLFYLGDGAGKFTAIKASEKIIPHTTTTTMSLKTADLRNSGNQSIYAAQIAGRSSGVSERLNMRPIEQYCDGIEREADKALCQQNIDVKRWYRAGHSFDPAYAQKCDALTAKAKLECRGMLVKDLAIQQKNPGLCELIPKSQRRARQYCDMHFLPVRTKQKIDSAIHHEQIKGRNVLLEKSPSGVYQDTAIESGLDVGGWSWDVKIADFDNDGWQDIYIVNGTWVPNEVSPSNMYFSNKGGETFVEKAQAFGLEDYLITAAAAQVDIDNDGDLDIITVPVNGPIKLFINHATSNSITFSLRDHLANRFGIGAKLTAYYGEDGELSQSRELQLGGGFMSFDAQQIHFGLGEYAQIDSLDIRWSDGSLSTLEGPLDSGRHYTLTRDNRQ